MSVDDGGDGEYGAGMEEDPNADLFARGIVIGIALGTVIWGAVGLVVLGMWRA